MKKNLLKIALTLSIAFILSIVGCKKETIQTTSNDVASAQELETIINETDEKYNEVEVVDGGEDKEFYAENEGLPESYLLTEQDMDEAGFKRTVEKRFIRCIKKLELSDEQAKKLRMVLRSYEECKANDIKKHRFAYESLRNRIENIRKEYLAKLKRGDITREQFAEKMQLLRKDFVESLRKIKQSHASNLKMCYDKFIRGIKTTLTDRQWKAFIECYRG
ncbi:MAG: hypothetical protein Q8K70_02195 [Bacteroidota bacterium]|nr:hypothetical protein [Bacteroidota bacterium]